MLPTLSVPEFKTTLPSTGKTIAFRPFLVKEEKVLLIALEDGSKEAVSNAIINLLDNCILTKDIDAEKLPTFDVEYMFLQIRSKSVGESVDMYVRHGNDTICDHKTKVSVKLEDITVSGEIADGKIMLTDTIGIKLKYPSYSRYNDDKSTEMMFDNVYKNIEYVYDTENVYDDFSAEEIEEWINGLSKEQFDKILKFFNNIPKLSHKIEWTCEKCGKEDYAIVEGLKGFFTSV